jgi:hypothetical protein
MQQSHGGIESQAPHFRAIRKRPSDAGLFGHDGPEGSASLEDQAVAFI